MFTIAYKSAYIHGFFHTEQQRIQFPDGTFRLCVSMHAAKCIITRNSKKTI